MWLKLPIYLTSHTMKLLNQKNINLRKLTNRQDNVASTIKREPNKSLYDSLEVDKTVFIQKLKQSSSSHCFRLLRMLGFSKSFPSVMSYSKFILSPSSENGNGYRTFFGSVFCPKTEYFSAAFEICSDDLKL